MACWLTPVDVLLESVKAPPSKSLKRTARIEFPSKPLEPTKPERTKDVEASAKKKKVASPGHTRRKPTLIRNLGGAGAAKGTLLSHYIVPTHAHTGAISSQSLVR